MRNQRTHLQRTLNGVAFFNCIIGVSWVMMLVLIQWLSGSGAVTVAVGFVTFGIWTYFTTTRITPKMEANILLQQMATKARRQEAVNKAKAHFNEKGRVQ